MFAVIFFSTLFGALIFMLIQIRASVDNGPITKMLKQHGETYTDSIMARERARPKKRSEQGVQEETRKLRSHTKEEEMWQRAYQDHENAIIATGADSFMVNSLYSTRLTVEYAVLPDPSFPLPPSGLGLWLSNPPNTRRMNETMKCYARVPIGAVLPWHRDHVRGDLITDSVMVRVNTPYRWIHLSVTRYDTDLREEIIGTFLKGLDANLFVDPSPQNKANPTGEWMMWDSNTNTLKTN